jgi:hypothetical protein
VIAVLLGVVLARLAGMVSGVRRMAMGRVRVMRGLLVSVGFMVLGSFAMVLGGVLMVLGGSVVMIDDLVFGHRDLRGDTATLGGACCMKVTGRCRCRWIV